MIERKTTVLDATIIKDTLVRLDGEDGPEWYTADVIMPEPGSEHDTPVVVPGTLKRLDVESLPLTAPHRQWVKAKLKLAALENRINRKR
jgi:hypothetical protein